jgi:hypothetical protein
MIGDLLRVDDVVYEVVFDGRQSLLGDRQIVNPLVATSPSRYAYLKDVRARYNAKRVARRQDIASRRVDRFLRGRES